MNFSEFDQAVKSLGNISDIYKMVEKTHSYFEEQPQKDVEFKISTYRRAGKTFFTIHHNLGLKKSQTLEFILCENMHEYNNLEKTFNKSTPNEISLVFR